jgi:hypothetical protein
MIGRKKDISGKQSKKNKKKPVSKKPEVKSPKKKPEEKKINPIHHIVSYKTYY